MPTSALEIRRTYPVPIERVFDAWTNPRVMSSWFYVGARWTAEVENDLRVGGAYRIAMQTDEGETLVCHGVYRELEPPHRVAFTWNSHLHSGSLVTIDLRPVGDGTELTLTHSGLPTEELMTAHNQGWLGCIANFERVVAGSPSPP
jgi:uncharacterized protein YndB with AHSA1/START domain